MALPTRGLPDWDDELNGHINTLDASVQAATSKANVAASDAAYARNRADEVHTAVIGTADAATAGFVNDAASSTRAALSAKYAAKVLDETTAVDQTQELFRIVPASNGSGDFRAIQRSIDNADATVNHVTYFGWNVGDTHSREVAGKPAIAMGFESNFYDTPIDHGAEWYIEAISADGTNGLSRPFYARNSWETGKNDWTIHCDIGNTGGGHFDVYAGKANPVKFTVSATAAQFQVPLSVRASNFTLAAPTGQAILTVNGVNPTLYFTVADGAGGGTDSWLLQSAGIATFNVRDIVNARDHLRFVSGASSATARTEFYSGLYMKDAIAYLQYGSGAGFGSGTTPATFVADSTAQAIGTGGQATFTGKYDTAGSYTEAASIKALKETATSGQYGFHLGFATRPDGGALTERLRVLAGGDAELLTTAKGIIMKSPDGTRYRVTVANGGTIAVAAA